VFRAARFLPCARFFVYSAFKHIRGFSQFDARVEVFDEQSGRYKYMKPNFQ
jgi:hypothetical protein